MNERITERFNKSNGSGETPFRFGTAEKHNYKNDVFELEDKIRRLDALIIKWRV